jgi:class 3 adenylate cyclase
VERAGRESRKIVTILFCDVVGSTAVAEGLDSESVRAMLSLLFGRAREVVERNGGTVEKFIGDAVVGAFGVPRLHEDDALRGVRSAVQLQEAVSELNAQVEKRWGLQIQVRIGVNTGEVVVGDPSRGQSFVSGDAVNVAARLEQAAEGGEILIGDETRRLVRDAALMERVELVLKGKARPVAAWRVVALAAASQEAPEPGQLGSGMVGRQVELARLRASFEQVASQRSRCASSIAARFRWCGTSGARLL